MEILQTAAVVTANVLLPGSGVLVNSGFELAKICFQITQVLSGMEETAAAIKTQYTNIMEDVDEFSYVLGLLDKRVQHQERFTNGVRKTILKFEKEVKEYDRVVNKFTKNKNILKQLVFRREVDTVSVSAKKAAAKLVVRFNLKCSIDGSNNHGLQDHSAETKTSLDALNQVSGSGNVVADCNRIVRSLTEQLDKREKRYMEFADSRDVTKEMSDADNQEEMQPLRTSADVNNLPDWYITEDEVEVDMTTIVGFGENAKIYKGKLTGDTLAAVNIFNASMKRSEEAKQKFIGTMKLWERLRHHDSICRLYGACYLTAAPFVVMEYCGMGPLDKFLRQDERNRYRFTLEILAQAAQRIIKMHSVGIVHSDFKCDNILVTGSRQAKVCDFDRSFDWVAVKNRCADGATTGDSGIEISEAVQWLAPECIEGKLPSPASDVYSFGMTLHQALMGRLPYYHIGNDKELRQCKLAHELPKRSAELISDDLWNLIAQTSRLEPQKRPAMHKVIMLLESASRKHLGCPNGNEGEDGDNEDSTSLALLPTESAEDVIVEQPAVRAPFSLARICAKIGLILDGMGKNSLSIETQSENIQDGVGEFSYVLSTLKQQHEDALSVELQYTVIEFENAVMEYERVINCFKTKSLLKQLVLHSEMDAASAKTWASKAKLIAELISEGCIAAAGNTSPPSPTTEAEYRKLRYMAFMNSPEIAREIADVDSQREILALIKHLGNRTSDLVTSALTDKLWARASTAVKSEIENLPDWYISEDEIEIDRSSSIGCGGDATMSTGVQYPSRTSVTVQTFNTSFKHADADEAKQKFIGTMNIWHKLKHQNVCELHGACYLTATPFMAMELCNKEPFDNFLRLHESSRGSLALNILLQAAAGVQSMHSLGIIHGDLKCDNILV